MSGQFILCCLFLSRPAAYPLPRLHGVLAKCCSEADAILLLLSGSMYFWSWLIQLNRGYKNNETIARTGISTLNGHIWKTVKFFEKLKKINCIFFIMGLDKWFRNFPQWVFCHFWLICGHFRSFLGC